MGYRGTASGTRPSSRHTRDLGASTSSQHTPASASGDRPYPSRGFATPAPWSPTPPPCGSEAATACLARNPGGQLSESRSIRPRPCSQGSVRPSAGGSIALTHPPLPVISFLLRSGGNLSGPRPRPRRRRSGTTRATSSRRALSIGLPGRPSRVTAQVHVLPRIGGPVHPWERVGHSVSASDDLEIPARRAYAVSPPVLPS